MPPPKRVRRYAELGPDPIDMAASLWHESDRDEWQGSVIHGGRFPSHEQIIARYAVVEQWLDDNCKGGWWIARQGVTFHFELSEDAFLYQMFWGAKKLDNWISRSRLLKGLDDDAAW